MMHRCSWREIILQMASDANCDKTSVPLPERFERSISFRRGIWGCRTVVRVLGLGLEQRRVLGFQGPGAVLLLRLAHQSTQDLDPRHLSPGARTGVHPSGR